MARSWTFCFFCWAGPSHSPALRVRKQPTGPLEASRVGGGLVICTSRGCQSSSLVIPGSWSRSQGLNLLSFPFTHDPETVFFPSSRSYFNPSHQFHDFLAMFQIWPSFSTLSLPPFPLQKGRLKHTNQVMSPLHTTSQGLPTQHWHIQTADSCHPFPPGGGPLSQSHVSSSQC